MLIVFGILLAFCCLIITLQKLTINELSKTNHTQQKMIQKYYNLWKDKR